MTVLLGDKYFAKCSAKTAREIVEHRTKQIETRLEKNDVAEKQILERYFSIKAHEVNFFSQRGGQLDSEFNDEDLIKEEYDEERDKIIDQQRNFGLKFDEI